MPKLIKHIITDLRLDIPLLKAYGYRAYLFESNKEIGKKRKVYKVKLKVYIKYLIKYIVFN